MTAEDAAGNVGEPSAAAAATVVGDTEAPSVPTGLHATPGTTRSNSGGVASADNVGVTGYRVIRGGV